MRLWPLNVNSDMAFFSFGFFSLQFSCSTHFRKDFDLLGGLMLDLRQNLACALSIKKLPPELDTEGNFL